MNADAFRHLYDYHFAANRKLWDMWIVELTQEQFEQELDYSVGSVRNHIVHLMNVDRGWFTDLRGVEHLDDDSEHLVDRAEIRVRWDKIEQDMRAYLAKIEDDMLFTKPLSESPDDVMFLWQVLLHVANHGTDHRAQLLRMLHDHGMKTEAQDYFFYIVGDL